MTLLWLFAALPVHAQQQSPTLQGTVVDSSGAVVPGVALTLTNASTGAARSAVTDAGGAYIFQQLPVGSYRLRVEKAGFRAFEQGGVELLIGRTLRLDVTLTVSEVGEAVTVESGAATVSSEDAALGNSITEREVSSLPSAGRNPITLFSLQPGVVFTGESDPERLLLGINNRLDDREGAVFGVRGNQSAINIDGAEVGDTESQAAFGLLLPVTLDSVKEFRVTTNGANASEFNTGGPQVTIITQSGTNDFRGNLRYYRRDDRFAANSFFNNSLGVERPRLYRNVFGASLGGPVVRDRLFFFGDYEGRRERSEQLVRDQRVPSDTLRQGVIRYTNAAGQVVSLTPERLRQIDPARLGFNPAIARIFDLYPRPNQPTPAQLLSFDDPLNYGYFRFNSPVRTDTNIYTARVDWAATADGRHTLFWRGTAADFYATLRPPVLPGLDPSRALINRSKGFVLSYTAQESTGVVNNFTWGFTLPRINERGAEGDGFAPHNLATPYGFDGFGGFGDLNRGVDRHALINDISDDVTLLRGGHTIQFGALLRFGRNRRTSYENAFGDYRTSPAHCRGGCDLPFNTLLTDPDASLRPANNFQNRQRFRNAFFTLTAPLNALTTNFALNPRTGEYSFAEPRELDFVEDVYEAYVQDVWRARPNLTITAGLRYGYAAPIYEANGFQLRPLVDVQEWFAGRVRDMNAGVPADRTPFISFDRAGKANERPSWYEPDYNNFAPRIAVAWSPKFESGLGGLLFGESRGVLRGGFGIYYQRVGGALAYTTDRYGSPGLLQFGFTPNTPAPFSLANAPRFGGSCTVGACANLPPGRLYLSPPDSLSFPFTPQYGEFEGNFIVDNRLRNPSTMHLNLSYQRELPGRVTLDVGYVGTRGRNLLAKADVAQFYGDLRDPVSGQTLNQAYRMVADLIGPDPFNPRIDPFDSSAVSRIAPIAFFQNMMPNMPNAGFFPDPTLSPTQAFYVYAAQFAPDWANALYLLDFDPYIFGSESPWSTRLDPERDGAVLFNPQFNNLPGWTNWGESDFHGMQLTVRKNFGRSAFALNYSFSKSIDNTSAAENATENNAEFFYDTGLIADAFRPRAQRARSDFDLRHNLNAHWLVDLPFGRGGWFGSDAGGALDSVIGDWQLAGILRWHSGFPLSPANGGYQATNTFGATFATVTGRLRSDLTRNAPNGRPNLFRDPAAARALVAYTKPGEAGSRNVIDGPGYFTLDLGLHKSFRMPWSERQNLQFRVTGYNVTNNANFSIRPPFSRDYNFGAGAGASFGALTRTTGARGGAREVEFALRYTF